MRMPNTATVMKNDPLWIKVGKKHYIHSNGSEIIYNHNKFMWCVGAYKFSTLHEAKYEAETGYFANLMKSEVIV